MFPFFAIFLTKDHLFILISVEYKDIYISLFTGESNQFDFLILLFSSFRILSLDTTFRLPAIIVLNHKMYR